ncbi:cell wall-binding repeat-containing protein [Euzebya pacifica]|uniref:cell wall-binding repeat-containing protein n=1 Tax=Euzebya pacifica TaxID=1608957 RepID=UPI0030F5168B
MYLLTRRLRPGAVALAVTIVVALLGPLPAFAGPLPGGSAAGSSQGDFSSPGAGPTVAGLEWAVQHPQLGRDGSHATQVIRDSEGHVVLNAHESQPDGTTVDVLVAIDADDGSVAWQLDNMDSGCLPVASDDGFVYAFTTGGAGHTVADLPGILEIDAADGSVVRAWEGPVTNTPGDVPDDGNPACLGGDLDSGHLVLAGDMLLFNQRRNFDRWLVGLDLSGADMTMAWETYFDGWEGSFFPRLVVAPDEASFYFPFRLGFDTDTPNLLGVFDVATGATLSTTEVGDVAQVVALDGGIVVHDDAFPETVTRYDRSGDDLVEDWSVVYERDDTVDQAGLGYWVDRLALADDVIVTVEPSGDSVFAISLETGQPVWTHDPTPSFLNTGEPKVDAKGTVWYSAFGFGLSAVDSRTGDLVTTTGDDPDAFFGDFRGERIAPITDDGRVIMVNTAFSVPASGVGLQLAAVSQGTARLDAETPDDVAIQICQLLFPTDDTAGGIVLARNDVFADALAGAPLAGDDACILYTDGGPDIPLDTDTRAEIDRALPDGGRVNILGSENAVSAAVEQDLRDAGYEIVRFGGASRVETAVEIAVEVLRQHPGTTEALLATGNNFPDSVLGGAFGGAVGRPILLTVGDDLHPATAQLLADENITSTVALGGSAVVPDAAVSQAPGGRRLAGANRFETGALIASDLWSEVIGTPDPATREFIVVDLSNSRDGDAWTYALASAPLAVRRGAPQLGVEPTRLPQETQDFLDAIGFTTPPGLTVVGGVAVVSEAVVTQIEEGTGSGG